MIQIAVKTSATLARGLRVLEAIAARQPAGLAELTEALGEDKSALQRALATLHDTGWIAPSGPGVWELTTRALSIAGHAAASSPVVARARPLLGALRDETGETAHLALLDGADLVVVDIAEARQVVRTALYPGQRIAADASAGGRAVCAALDAAARRALFADPSGLLPDAEYVRIAARGWAVCEGDVKPGWTSIASPVRTAGGAPVGAVVTSGPAQRLTPDRYDGIGALLHDVALELSRR
ncbi:IclR family transcriptional regulator [Tomitella gaofuii]|uniref:IclR family transcriptional regulator n=1 Tax=Tomitella gaofuii TaxID=2760083 RepID=UPI0015FB465C|nr:IclR family transcriptional regulator [Tomitella gaofuii]